MKLISENVEDIIALSPMQEAMLFHHLSQKEKDQYFEQVHIILEGSIDKSIFENSWKHVVKNNEMLRTVFRWDNLSEPVQIIMKQYPINIKYYDCESSNEKEAKSTISKIKVEAESTGFNLQSVPFFIILCKESQQIHHMIINHHHILYDGWGNALLLKEFLLAYNSLHKKVKLINKDKTKYKEFVRYIKRQKNNEYKKFWQEYFEGFSHQKPNTQNIINDEAIGVHNLVINDSTTKKLKAFVKKRDITVASIFYGAWGAILQKQNLINDVLIGVTVSGRGIPIRNIGESIGLFINTLPLRIRAEAFQSVEEFITKINKDIKKLYIHEHTPLTDIKKYIKLQHDEEIFESIVVVENYPVDLELLYEKSVIKVKSFNNNDNKTNYPITIEVKLLSKWELGIKYRKSIFDEASIDKLHSDYISLIEEMIDNPTERLENILYETSELATAIEDLDVEFDI